MTATTLQCRNEQRRYAVREDKLNGLDYLEVSDDQLTLTVFFLGKAPEKISKDNIRILGGLRITGINILSIEVQREQDEELDDCIKVTVDRYGDFSSYTLCLVETVLDEQKKRIERPLSGFDPRYTCLDFNFKVSCPSDLDCKQTSSDCPAEPAQIPEINYLAKDYASFCQLIYDRLSLVMPEWQERHAPDLGVTLVELLAYVGDHLSYYQDAVATEAYLDTARQRISVRRHARLVDYLLHEGCNARAWVCLTVSQDTSLQVEDFYLITDLGSANNATLLKHEELPKNSPRSYLVYEPLVEKHENLIKLYKAQNTIHIYTWGDVQCCLAKGATSATLVKSDISDNELNLKAGQVLIFEEVKGAKTGNPADANLKHRHAVCLTSVQATKDPLTEQYIVEVQWNREDALPFAVCVSGIKQDDCTLIENISVVHGNVLLVDQGESINDALEPVPSTILLPDCNDDCGVREATKLTAKFNPSLTRTDLTYSQPLPATNSCKSLSQFTPASALLTQDVRKALAQVSLKEGNIYWTAKADLLGSHGDDRHFVVEINDNRQVQLRFGDNDFGQVPKPDTQFQANYRIGNGIVGNVGAEVINRLVFKNNVDTAITNVRNPFPAQGGSSPETLAEARLLAPHAFLDNLQRAITADDYAQIVMRDFADKVQKAAATLRWTGSWYEVLVAIDPFAASEDEPQLLCKIAQHLRRYRRMGHDVQVALARYVPLELAMTVYVLSGYLRGHVKSAVMEVFSNRLLANGQRGFFHPDKLSFGDGVYLSQLIATAQAVTGVENVQVTVFKRQFEAADNEIDNGVLPLTALEIARLDNDPNFPENGKLTVSMEGGR
jgi:hypothetical protein